MKRKESPLRIAFVIFNYFFCVLVGIVCLMPVLHVLAVSFSSKDAIVSGKVSFLPVDFTWDSYHLIIRDAAFFRAYLFTFQRTALGWLISITMTILSAYPLSQSVRIFPARNVIAWFFMGAILFSGGMIPNYLMVKNTGLYNTIWALVIPSAVPVFNVILMMNFFKSLPDGLAEAASIDGAGHFRILWQIVLPLSKASIATVSLFIILAHWNSWFDGMIYIKDAALKPLQTYLRSVIIADDTVAENAASLEDIINNVNSDSANGAKIFLALLPIMVIYPCMQKHFAKGLVRGSMKE